MDGSKNTQIQCDTDIIRNKFQLSTVQNVDPDASSVVDLSGHTALYNYDKNKETWSKTDVEGTLMVYNRIVKPRNMITIINKNSKSNFIEPITKNCDAQLKAPYVLLRDDSMSILGIWFADAEDVPRIYSVICSFIRQEEMEANKLSNGPSKNILDDKSSKQSASKSEDIMSMLSKARVEFDTRNEPLNDHSKSEGSNALTDFFAKVSSGTNLPVHSVNSDKTSNPVLQQIFQGAAAFGGQASVNKNSVVKANPVSVPGSLKKQPDKSAAGSFGSGDLKQSAPISLEELEGKMRENLHAGDRTFENTSLSQVSKPQMLQPHMFSSTGSNIIQDFQNSSQRMKMGDQSSASLLSNSTFGSMVAPDSQKLNDFSKFSNDSGLGEKMGSSHEKNEIEKLLGVGKPSETQLGNSGASSSFMESSLLSQFAQGSDKSKKGRINQEIATNFSQYPQLNQTQFALAISQALKKPEFVSIIYESYLEICGQKGSNTNTQ